MALSEPEILTERSRRTLKQLHDELMEGRRDQMGAMVDQPEILRAIDWLKCCRRDDGFWGEAQDGTTSLAALALTNWAAIDRDNPRAEAVAAAAADFDFDTTAKWIALQATRGQWLTPWYSAVAVQALTAMRYEGDALREGLAKLRSLDPMHSQMWHDRVHHAAQIVTALGMSGGDMELRERWKACILRHASPELAPYVAGQAVHALTLWTTTSLEEMDEDLVAPLRRFLGRTALSKSSFMDYAASLHALAVLDDGHAELEDLVAMKARELFTRMEKGSWYRDAEMTAWALLSLHRVGSVAQVLVDKVSFNTAFVNAAEAIDDGQRAARREVAALAAAIVLLLVGAVAVALWNPAESVAVTALLSGPLAAAFVPTVIRLMRRLR